MRVRGIVGPALLGLVLLSSGLISPAQASASSGPGYSGRHYVVYVQRRPYRRLYLGPRYRRRVVIVGPAYRRHHRVVYVYRRPYYYRRYHVRGYVR